MANLVHRGPDSTNDYRDANLFVRHFRLMILGNESDGMQPMVSFNKDVVVAFNGEIYNYRELAVEMGRPELIEFGDTRVLTEFLALYGVSRMSSLNGMFSLVLHFRSNEKTYLIRDRFGIKPLFYRKIKDSIYFASEIKSLKSVSPARLHQDRIRCYLDHGVYPQGEETFYQEIKQVSAGCWLCYENERQTQQSYYNLRNECTSLSEENLEIQHYESLFEDAIDLRLRSDVPISLHYSGGTDSTALMLKIREAWGENPSLTAFSMGYEEAEFDESNLAKSYCDQIGVKHQKVMLSHQEVPELAATLHGFQDEPYGGIPTIAYYKLNMVERQQGFIVSLEGQGGDETFGGYLYHAYLAMYDLLITGKNQTLLNKLMNTYDVDSRRVVKVAEQLISSGFQSHTDLTDLRSTPPNRSPELFFDWLKTIQTYDILINKIPRTLRFNDRASMACGREIRFPMLDHRVLACGLSFTHEQKYANGMCKSPLREIIRRTMKNTFSLPKRSIVTPQTRWLKGNLSGWAKHRIDLLRQAAGLPSKYFERAEKFFRSDDESNSFYVWQLINLSFFFD